MVSHFRAPKGSYFFRKKFLNFRFKSRQPEVSAKVPSCVCVSLCVSVSCDNPLDELIFHGSTSMRLPSLSVGSAADAYQWFLQNVWTLPENPAYSARGSHSCRRSPQTAERFRKVVNQWCYIMLPHGATPCFLKKSSDSKKIINTLVSALRNAFLIAKDLNVTPFRQTQHPQELLGMGLTNPSAWVWDTWILVHVSD